MYRWADPEAMTFFWLGPRPGARTHQAKMDKDDRLITPAISENANEIPPSRVITSNKILLDAKDAKLQSGDFQSTVLQVCQAVILFRSIPPAIVSERNVD